MTIRRLRVAAVGITPPNYKASGGISAGIQLTQRIAKLCDVRMFIMAAQDETTIEDGLPIDRVRAKSLAGPIVAYLPRTAATMSWRPNLRPWLESWRPEVVHLHNPHPPGALTAAARICNELAIPYVISTHGFVEFDEFARGMNTAAWKAPIYRQFIRRPVANVARRAARICMLSPEEEPILRAMGAKKEQLSVVTNGVDPYFLEPVAAEERSRLTARFKLPSGTPLMLYVGNHTRNKGIDVLLRALGHMQTPGTAIIAGAIRSRTEHQALLAECGTATDTSRFLFTDFISKEELRALYQSVDLFVFPSRADTLPLVILEAMVSGLPVVSTRVGGIPYEVVPETGALVSPGDPQALARELDRFCADRSLRASCGAAGRQRALEKFSWEESAAKAVDIYRQILESNSVLATRN
jgi:alpha-maltose-1-phosphate synthase